MTDPNDDMLDDIFAQARAAQPVPSDDLMARVIGDAVGQITPVPVRNAPGVWAQLSQMLGGWPVLSGLATAGVVGLWIGVAPPATLAVYAADLMGDTDSINVLAQTALFDFGGFTDG